MDALGEDWDEAEARATGAKVLFYGTSWMRQWAEAILTAHTAAGDVESVSSRNVHLRLNAGGQQWTAHLKGGGSISLVRRTRRRHRRVSRRHRRVSRHRRRRRRPPSHHCFP